MISRLKTMLKNFNEERGAVLPAVLIGLLMGSVVLIPALLGHTGTGVLSGNMYENKDQELYAADAGASDAIFLMAAADEANPDGGIDALLAQEEDGDPEKHIYEFTDPVNNKTVNVEISFDIDSGYYVVKSTAKGSDGSDTTVEVWCLPPVIPEADLFSAVSLDGSLGLGSDLGTHGIDENKVVGTADGMTAQFDLPCKSYSEETEVIDPDWVYATVVTEVWVDGLLQERKESPDDEVYDYELNLLECMIEFDSDSIPLFGQEIVATYEYCEMVNLYANGDIEMQGSAKVFGDAWIPFGNTVVLPTAGTWYGDIIYTRKLRLDSRALPEIPVNEYHGKSSKASEISIAMGTYIDGTYYLGDVHVVGVDLNVDVDVTITGTVWVDGSISDAAKIVTGIHEETGLPYFLVAEAPGDGAINIQGSSLEAILYAPNGQIYVGGNVPMYGAVVSYGDIDCRGSSLLVNALPLTRAPFGYFPMDVKTWKIY